MSLRALVLADRAPGLDLAAVLARPEVRCVLTLGDLQPAWIEPLADFGRPKLGVYGNHDETPYMQALGIVDVHLQAVPLGGGTVCGFEGCVRYRPGGAHQYTQEEAEALAERLPAGDVLMAHSPPLGVNDDPGDRAHVGFRGLRAWVARHAPDLLLHGHTYPRPGHAVTRVGSTQVVHVQGARLLDLPL